MPNFQQKIMKRAKKLNRMTHIQRKKATKTAFERFQMSNWAGIDFKATTVNMLKQLKKRYIKK